MTLTHQEIEMLRALSERENGMAISGQSHLACQQLIDAKYAKSRAVSMNAILYEITELGRKALSAAQPR
jgi:hypothetical protein